MQLMIITIEFRVFQKLLLLPYNFEFVKTDCCHHKFSTCLEVSKSYDQCLGKLNFCKSTVIWLFLENTMISNSGTSFFLVRSIVYELYLKIPWLEMTSKVFTVVEVVSKLFHVITFIMITYNYKVIVM